MRAGVAAVIAAGVVWIGSNPDFNSDNLPIFSHGPLGENTTIIVISFVGLAVLFWGNQGFPLLWALMVPTHALIFWQRSGFVDFTKPPTFAHGIAAYLEACYLDWSLLAGGLLLATWVALFRDGVLGFRHIIIPVAVWLLSQLLLRFAWGLLSGDYEGTVREDLWTVSLFVICGVLPMGFTAWQIWLTSRPLASSAPAT